MSFFVHVHTRKTRGRRMNGHGTTGQGLPLKGEYYNCSLFARISLDKLEPQSAGWKRSQMACRKISYASSRPIGNNRTRTRDCSNTATQPLCRSASIAGRFARRRAICFSGLRSVPRRKSITDGRLSFWRDRSVPKSVSAETTMRSSFAALSMMASSSAACMP